MNESSMHSKPGSSVPKWVIIICCLVGSAVVPLFMALSPHFSELIKGAVQAKVAQTENEKTALGTILQLVNTTTTQVRVLSSALETEQGQKKTLSDRVTELERLMIANGQALSDCEQHLRNCEKSEGKEAKTFR